MTHSKMADRVEKVGENVFSITYAIDHRDGDGRVTVGWDDEEGEWFAETSPVPPEIGGSHFAYGDTQIKALCELVMSLTSLTDALNNLLNHREDAA
jgi:hypothetical protein